jgi:hypothetical protein
MADDLDLKSLEDDHPCKLLVEALNHEGFAFSCPIGNQPPDFRKFVRSLYGCRNLVLCVPNLHAEEVDPLMLLLCSLPSLDDNTFFVETATMIDPLGFLFDFHTSQRVLHNAPAAGGPLSLNEFQVEPAWAHETNLHVTPRGSEFKLRVVHLNLPKENAILGFLMLHQLRPRLYIE